MRMPILNMAGRGAILSPLRRLCIPRREAVLAMTDEGAECQGSGHGSEFCPDDLGPKETTELLPL